MEYKKMIFIKITISILISIILIFFITCGPVPFHRTGGPIVDVNVAWQSSQTRSITSTDFTLSSEENEKVFEAKAYTEALQLINDHYATLGTKIATLTPSKFEIVVSRITLVSSDDDETITLLGYGSGGAGDEAFLNTTIESFYADFTNPLSMTPKVMIEQYIYDSLILMIEYTNREYYEYDPDDPGAPAEPTGISLEHEIIVEIPGYTDDDLPNIDCSDEAGTFERFYLGNDEFRFTFGELLPICWASNKAINWFVFSTSYNQNELILQGYDGVPDSVRIANYSTNPSIHSSYTDFPGILLPYSGIDLRGLTSATFQIYLDITDIIEVYDPDGNSPGTKSDDIVVFANGFWNRFEISVKKN